MTQFTSKQLTVDAWQYQPSQEMPQWVTDALGNGKLIRNTVPGEVSSLLVPNTWSGSFSPYKAFPGDMLVQNGDDIYVFNVNVFAAVFAPQSG